MGHKTIPINKGNYSLDTPAREAAFEARRAYGWEKEYQAYRQAWSERPRKQIVGDYPLLVDAELSSICNLHCPMCYTITDEFRQRVKTTLMDFGLFRKIVDEIGGKVPALRLSLRGEPTLHPRFVDCIRYAKDKGIGEVSFLTNGSRLTPDFFREIMQAGADWITISVDGLDEVYEGIRRPLKFRETLGKLMTMRQMREEAGLQRPVIKVQTIWPAIRENAGGYYNTIAPWADLVAFNPLIDYLGRDEEIIYDEEISCPQLYQRLVIGADGLVMPCSNDEEGSMIVGNVMDQGISGIWRGKKLQALRDLQGEKTGFLEIPTCRRCYLPRKTEDSERVLVNGREIVVRNYVNRSQRIGE
ncbi:MAG: radical SAM protein [Nitrospirales bacterium]|nr:radical SAM protein [Nitrospirales bacterium]